MSYAKLNGPDTGLFHSDPHQMYKSKSFQKTAPQAYVYNLKAPKSGVTNPKPFIAEGKVHFSEPKDGLISN